MRNIYLHYYGLNTTKAQPFWLTIYPHKKNVEKAVTLSLYLVVKRVR